MRFDANVVPEGFVSSLRRLAEYTDHPLDDYLFRLSWEQIAEECEMRPWFAEKPGLLNSLASSLSEERMDDASKWVLKCEVAGMDGIGNIGSWFPKELFHGNIIREEHLPKRLLQIIHKSYSYPAIALLTKAGLKVKPSEHDLSVWVVDGQLNTDECFNLLRYLTEQDRFKDYSS